ncbi:hypothetical protein BpHYR1_041870 [Brachionus plicatilis]|uniref:Uncharacterized protein n=1 Tax=Brachionus plicatilis TaxID=10195 RepID=A0A3M7PCW0_BRAPC|nr:hypothetical protein BpHYR1_041870 [Brachionus plicatilis]
MQKILNFLFFLKFFIFLKTKLPTYHHFTCREFYEFSNSYFGPRIIIRLDKFFIFVIYVTYPFKDKNGQKLNIFFTENSKLNDIGGQCFCRTLKRSLIIMNFSCLCSMIFDGLKCFAEYQSTKGRLEMPTKSIY